SGTTPWISVNWDRWSFPEQGTAFGDVISPEAGADLFLRLLARAPRQAVVSATDLQSRIRKWIRLEDGHPVSSAASTPGTHARPNLSSTLVTPASEIEKALVEIWERILGVSPIGTHDKFVELGGHSLVAIQLITQIRERFGIDFPPKRLFESPTVA